MKIIPMYKLLISIFLIIMNFFSYAYAKEPAFISTSPSLTELMYAINAQDMLKAVSTQCDFPEDVKLKPIIGDAYFLNEEMLLKIKPDYFLSLYSSDFKMNKYKRFGIKVLTYNFEKIADIYTAIENLGKLTGKEDNASNVILRLKNNIEQAKTLNKNPKKILYVVSLEPFMTIGAKSFITDVIEKSGNYSVTKNLSSYYPAVSIEYAMKLKPDIVVLDYFCLNQNNIEKFFPNAKIIKLTRADCDLIERTTDRIYLGIELFAKMGKD